LLTSRGVPRARPNLRHITVDLTPLLPGANNGGAKLLATSLIHQLAMLAPETRFTLLTTAASNAELANLDGPNVGRQCVDADLEATPGASSLSRARVATRVLLNTLVPSVTVRKQVKDGLWTLVKRHRRASVASATPADMLFCPFTAPFFFDPRVPLVSLVHDLQFLEYPQFFDEDERAGRRRHFDDACERADRLVCVSEFVRQRVLANSGLPPKRVQTIHSAVIHAADPDPLAALVASPVLERLGIGARRFLLYPANFWPHKNHRVLFDAFALYQRKCPTSNLALVCTGAPGPGAEEARAYVQRVLPGDSVGFAGFLPEREFGALLQTCRALIFPSLYEGFGLPVLEAMACDRPVLCSNTTSLPEVAGDAALLFEPHDPAAIAAAIERLESSPDLESSLIQRGRQRVARFGLASHMAARYLAVFEDVVASRAS
jgi:glycosyltransferase involved in cell wall biosynthesis